MFPARQDAGHARRYAALQAAPERRELTSRSLPTKDLVMRNAARNGIVNLHDPQESSFNPPLHGRPNSQGLFDAFGLPALRAFSVIGSHAVARPFGA